MDKALFIIVAGTALSLGIFIFRYPLKIFEIQKRFYAKINWRIEPISIPKEIRNTKIMGLFLIVFVMAAVVSWILMS